MVPFSLSLFTATGCITVAVTERSSPQWLLGWHRHMFIARHIVLMTACHRCGGGGGEGTGEEELDTNQAKCTAPLRCSNRYVNYAHRLNFESRM